MSVRDNGALFAVSGARGSESGATIELLECDAHSLRLKSTGPARVMATLTAGSVWRDG